MAQLQPLPHTPRNTVFTALFNFLKTTVPAPVDPNSGKSVLFVTYSQLLKQWTDVNSANQPAMFLHRGPQSFEQKHVFGLTKFVWKVTVWVYFRVDGYKIDPSYPDQLTDSFIDGFEQAFQSAPLINRQTLNGNVYHCFIDGQVVSDPGLTDGQAVIVVPLTILV
jgi:hypothetical protein